MTRPLAVCCVAYRTPDLLRTCLASLAEHLPGVPVHVHDNSAGHAAELEATIPARVEHAVTARGQLR